MGCRVAAAYAGRPGRAAMALTRASAAMRRASAAKTAVAEARAELGMADERIAEVPGCKGKGDGVCSPMGLWGTPGGVVIKGGAQVAPSLLSRLWQWIRGARAAPNINKLNHIFGKAEHALDGFVKAQGGREKAFQAIQSAANKALAEGKLIPGPNGVLPSGNAGPIIDVAGTQIRLIGGRVIDGVVEIGSASRMGLP